MGKLKNTITINGKVYDVNNGQVVDNVSSAHHSAAERTSQHPKHTKHPKHIKPRHQVSDIIRPTQSLKAKHSSQNSSKTETVAVELAKPDEKKSKHQTKSPAQVNPAKRGVKKAKTLARNYVKKPTIKPTAKKEAKAPEVIALHSSVNSERLNRAKNTRQSHNVSRFGNTSDITVTKKVNHISVVPEPKKHKKPYDISDIPPQLPSNKAKAHLPKSKDLFESALSASKSHHQSYKPKKSAKRKSRKLSILAGSGTVILLLAFFVYQNVPTIALYTTSSKVGFQVTKPSYQPAGYGLKGPLEYKQGSVVLDFRSNSDDKQYSIQQTKTDLDSASLLNNYLAAENKDYSTEFANGRTVYIYGDNNATWVDGGIWYNLTNDANLNNEQLLKIVSSI
ncbi:DUF4367 domain-containing protein [Candidatus Saccharibacteria bacterium]|nr:DUF4367 domain-containing protein [Candidatus Saccharibacteria bacterium]